MKEKTKTVLQLILRQIPLVICAFFLCLYLFSGKEITAESLLNIAPEKPFFAALFLIFLYAFKSLTVFFPIMVLNVLGGFLFEPAYALIINAIGVIAELSVPYWVGRASGGPLADKLQNKYHKFFDSFRDRGSDFFKAFFLRVISCLPGDAVSMYFGAVKMPFLTCLTGSFLGALPGMITATLMGMSITDPGSPMFWISIGLHVGVSALFFLVYILWKKAREKAQ